MKTLLMVLAAIAAAQEAPPPGPAPDGPPITPGTISIESASSGAGARAADQPFVDAVEQKLADSGFTPLPGSGTSHGRYVATVSVVRASHGQVASSARTSGPDVNLFGTRLGGAVGVSLPSDKTRLGQLVSTELAIRIHRRDDPQMLWEGRAVTQQVIGTRDGENGAVATRLASALFRNFPGQSGLVVSVP